MGVGKSASFDLGFERRNARGQSFLAVQNAAARLIFELSPSEHITPSLLHYIGASSLNYVALCTQLSPDAVQRIWEHRATSYTVAFRSATVIFRLLCTADKNQVRRAGLLLCRPVCVEHTAAPYPRNSRLCYF